MAKNEIVFKGTKDGLHILLKGNSSFEEFKDMLDEKIRPSKRFFEGAKIIGFSGKNIQEVEYMELKNIIENQYGMEVIGDYNALNVNNSYDIEEKSKKYNEILEARSNIEEKGLFIRGTIRSGQLIKHNGNITIIGDVNPGAYLETKNSIIVMGIMRGTAHAGSDGNYDSYIAAFRLEPMQLRIGDIIARSPDGGPYKSGIPEIAVVKRGMIIVEPY